MRTLIVRLFSPEDEHLTGLQGLVQRPGGRAVRFLGADQLVELVRTLGNAAERESGTTGSSGTVEPEAADRYREVDRVAGDQDLV